MVNIVGDPLQLLITSDKIRWGLPIQQLFLFSAEINCRMPFEMFGEKVICRYEKPIDGIQVYLTPVFNQTGLFHLKGSFDQGETLDFYKRLKNKIIRMFGEPNYALSETWDGDELQLYPCNVWVFNDCILEAGICQKRFVPIGYVWLTKKESYRDVYDGQHMRETGWDPQKFIR